MGIFRTLALGVVGFSLYSTLRQRSRPRDAAVKPEPLQRWEGEGGNVPAANPSLKTSDGSSQAAPSHGAGFSSSFN